MKERIFLCFLSGWILSAPGGMAASYTLNLPAGTSAVANQLNNTGGNTLGILFPPGALPNKTMLTIYTPADCGGGRTYSLSPFGWSGSGNTATLSPGDGALVHPPNQATMTFSGTLNSPVLPLPLPCDCGRYYFLSRQTVGTGSYENVIGRQPLEGSQVARWNGASLSFVTNTFSGGTWSLGTPTILNIGESALFFIPCPEKWEQIPDITTNGLDVRATNPKILAGDFRCTATGPITEIKIRGSWLNDSVATQACFCIGIWSDIPRQGTNYSRPGTQFCNWCFTPNQYSFSVYTNGVNERFYDPNIPGTNGLIGSDSTIWEYIFTAPTNQTCIQTTGNVYWVSLTANCFDTNQFIFGWKTCPTNWNDDAVYGHVANTNTPLMDWQELRRPGTTNSLDLSFTVTTTVTNQPTQETNPPTTLVIDKWLQIPDTSTNGLDVRATDPKILADDFLCTNSGPITEVKVWGSWLDDKVAPAPCFCIGIWNDVPISETNAFSHPGQRLCSYCFYPGEFTSSPYTNDVDEKFFDPNIPAIIGSDTVIWEYDFKLPVVCWQTKTNIYWLSVTANCFDTNQFIFGWKTCPTNWNDDAVYGHVVDTNTPLMDWSELKRPPFYYYSLDLAFEILTETNLCACTNPPTIFCPTNIVLTSCGTNVSWSVTATSSCNISVSVISSPPSVTFFGSDSTNTVTAIATDVCGRTNACSFLVILHRPALNLHISIGGAPHTVTLSWPDGGILQEATSLLDPWTNLPLASSPYTVAADSSVKFYRLWCP